MYAEHVNQFRRSLEALSREARAGKPHQTAVNRLVARLAGVITSGTMKGGPSMSWVKKIRGNKADHGWKAKPRSVSTYKKAVPRGINSLRASVVTGKTASFVRMTVSADLRARDE
jgi:hypothetical protein